MQCVGVAHTSSAWQPAMVEFLIVAVVRLLPSKGDWMAIAPPSCTMASARSSANGRHAARQNAAQMRRLSTSRGNAKWGCTWNKLQGDQTEYISGLTSKGACHHTLRSDFAPEWSCAIIFHDHHHACELRNAKHMTSTATAAAKRERHSQPRGLTATCSTAT